VIFMESEQMYGDKGEVPDGEYIILLSCWYQTWRNRCYYRFFGKIIKEAHIAAELQEGISWNYRFETVRPMDYDTILTSLKKTNRLVVLEERLFASVLLKLLYCSRTCFWFSWCTNSKITTADTPAPYSPVLLKEWLPNADDVIKAVKKK
jgi:pyruvate dehydrogenase E1 component beta subunit